MHFGKQTAPGHSEWAQRGTVSISIRKHLESPGGAEVAALGQEGVLVGSCCRGGTSSRCPCPPVCLGLYRDLQVPGTLQRIGKLNAILS